MRILYVSRFFCEIDMELKVVIYEVGKEIMRDWKIICISCLNFKEMKMV